MEKSSSWVVPVTVVMLLGWVDCTAALQDCARSDSSLSCYGLKMMRNAVKHLAGQKSLQLVPGVEIVEIEASDGERAFNEINDYHQEGRVSGRIAKYLTSHELKVNLGEMLRRSELQSVVRSTLKTIHQEMGGDMEEARKKDKGGLGALMMMGMMMAKVLGTLGFGGVAMLAMKALGVSMMALLLSAILGLKKLSEGGDHKGRQNEEFRVSSHEPVPAVASEYAAEDYNTVTKRRRRSPKEQDSLAYRGWVGMVQ